MTKKPARSLRKALSPGDFGLERILNLIQRPAFSFRHEHHAHNSREEGTSTEQEVRAEATGL